MVEVILISLLFFVMVLGLIIYDKQMEKYYKKHCTLKVEAHIVERKRISGHGPYGVRFTLSDDFFRPVFSVDIDGLEHLIAEKKCNWTDRTLEEYPHLILWVNPQNTKQFRYDDERLVRMVSTTKKASYIAVGIVGMLMAAFAFAFS